MPFITFLTQRKTSESTVDCTYFWFFQQLTAKNLQVYNFNMSNNEIIDVSSGEDEYTDGGHSGADEAQGM